MSAKLRACIRLLRLLQVRSRVANRDVRQLIEGCDEQKALRYIKSLQAAGVPLETRGSGPETHYVIAADWRRRGLNFSLGDALSLQFGRKMLSFLEGTMVPDWLDDLRGKLEVEASPKTLDRQSALAKKLVYLSEPYRPYEVHNDTLNELITALLEESELGVIYKSRQGERRYTLQPLALVVYRRALYLLARKKDDDQVRRLPVERFLTAERGAAFAYPADFDPEAFVRTSFGIFDDNCNAEEVRLRFHAEVADLVRSRRWHATERFEPVADGRLDLVMSTQGAELGRLALEWGDRVEVVAPPELRRRVRRELEKALAQYGPVTPEPARPRPSNRSESVPACHRAPAQPRPVNK